MPDVTKQNGYSHKIFEILSRYSSIQVDQIKKDSKIMDDLGLDSFAAVELIYEVEMNFGIKVSQAELRKIQTVGDLLNLLPSYQMSKGHE